MQLILFDMDGVITDSEPIINEAAVRMFRELGQLVQPEDFTPFIGTGEDRYLGGVAEIYGIPLDPVEAKKRTYEIYLELVPTHLKAFPGAIDLVKECRMRGARTAVASSADQVKVHANLHQIGLPPDRFWDAVISGEMVERKKPHPDIFLHAARSVGIDASRCVVIEDAVHGIEAAKAAGMWCVAVAQTFPASRLSLADRVFPSLANLHFDDLLPPVE